MKVATLATLAVCECVLSEDEEEEESRRNQKCFRRDFGLKLTVVSIRSGK